MATDEPKSGNRVRVSFEEVVREDGTIQCAPFGTPYKFWCSAEYIRGQGGVVEVLATDPVSVGDGHQDTAGPKVDAAWLHALTGQIYAIAEAGDDVHAWLDEQPAMVSRRAVRFALSERGLGRRGHESAADSNDPEPVTDTELRDLADKLVEVAVAKFRSYTGTSVGQNMWNVDIEKTFRIVADDQAAVVAPVLAAKDAKAAKSLRIEEDLIRERDRCMEWADRLAYAIAPQSEIGEHSSSNDPWQNALEIAGRLRKQNSLLADARGELDAVRTVLKEPAKLYDGYPYVPTVDAVKYILDSRQQLAAIVEKQRAELDALKAKAAVKWQWMTAPISEVQHLVPEGDGRRESFCGGTASTTWREPQVDEQFCAGCTFGDQARPDTEASEQAGEFKEETGTLNSDADNSRLPFTPATPTEPRVWRDADDPNNAQPSNVYRVHDADGHVWEMKLGGDWACRSGRTPNVYAWFALMAQYGPLTEVVSGSASTAEEKP